MLSEVIAIDQNVVEVYRAEFIQIFSQYIVYETLLQGWATS